MTDQKHCEQCGREVASQTVQRPETFDVFGEEPVEIEATVTVCPECGSQLHDEALDDANFRRAYDIYRMRHDVPSPDQIRALRERLRLTQKALGRILGYGEVVVRRYETGAVPNNAHTQPLRLLLASAPVNHPPQPLSRRAMGVRRRLKY